ncbi:MAG: glucose 1-dehydrogenase [Reyranellaceae bacterium]
MGDLSNRVALVTGGASGIGAETCRALAEAGATVAVGDIQDEPGEALARTLGHGGFYLRLDVASEPEWQSATDEILRRCGRLDVLVNNAGIGGRGNIENTTVEDWDRINAVNVEGVFLGCKYAVAAMKRTGPGKEKSRGSIVNISSIAGIIGSAGPCAYTAAKGAVRLMSKAIAMECAEKGYDIRINSVHPGGIDTPILEPLYRHLGKEQAQALIGGMHPVNHMGEPRDIAEAVLFLASDRSKFMTGSEIVVDGGATSGVAKRFDFGRFNR